MQTIAGTGHRPNKLGGYSSATTNALIDLATSYFQVDSNVTIVSGMALGWDQALAIAAIRLGIPFIAAVPFAGQECKWPKPSQLLYNRILAKAKSIYIVSSGRFSASSMQRRNEWMVQKADIILALWDGSTGGTYNCVQYAKKMNVPVVNLWNKFKS